MSWMLTPRGEVGLGISLVDGDLLAVIGAERLDADEPGHGLRQFQELISAGTVL